MRTDTLFIFFTAVGLQIALVASVASDERNEEVSDEVEDISELQKRDQMEFDMAGIEEDRSLEDAHYLEGIGDELNDDEDSEAQQVLDSMESASELESEEEGVDDLTEEVAKGEGDKHDTSIQSTYEIRDFDA